MIKKFLVLFFITLTLVFVSCSKTTQRHDSQNETEILDDSSLTEFQKLMLEDYEYMWEILRENYPSWGVVKRRGIDADKVYEIYRKQINTVENKIDFFNLINTTINSFYKIGHLYLLDYKFFKEYQFAFKDYRDDKNYESCNDILFNSDVEEAYERLRIARGENKIDYEKYDLSLEEDKINNIKYYDLVENEVAYIEIKSFSNDINYDSLILQNIYEKVKDYKHIVFDVSHNRGGSSLYWENNIVKPIMGKHELSYTHYYLLQKGKYSESFIDINNYIYNELRPVEELPFFENINKDDFEFAPYFFSGIKTTYSNTDEKAVNGRIWVIIAGDSYSATDGFAYFCKETGFATLLGQKTKGDGLGLGTVLLKLPNSKYVINFKPTFRLNQDGSNNVEIGTKPDYYVEGVPRNINFIRECLKVIKNNQ